MMKIDLSGLDPSAPVKGNIDDLDNEIMGPPSFNLPSAVDFDGFQKAAVQMVKPAKGDDNSGFYFQRKCHASQSVKKIIEINPYMLGTMAGGAADCQFWHRNLGIKSMTEALETEVKSKVSIKVVLFEHFLLDAE
ncbi:hypothetical protein ACS0TY_026070 [Phlomoides rotata]